MSENKKIKNATGISYDNINFKSHLEYHCYKLLQEADIIPRYEYCKYRLIEPKKLTVGTCYAPRKKHLTKFQTCREITYTPDFDFYYKDIHVYYDAKGKSNDTYPLKKKLFLNYLENIGEPYIFFEPHNIAQIKQSIEILYELR